MLDQLGILLQRLISLESWYVSACTLWNVNCHRKVPRQARPPQRTVCQPLARQSLAVSCDPCPVRMAASYSPPERNTSEPWCAWCAASSPNMQPPGLSPANHHL